MNVLDLSVLFNALQKRPVRGSVSLNQHHNGSWIKIVQDHDAKTGGTGSKVKTIYSVFPWVVDPNVPVLYFEVYLYHTPNLPLFDDTCDDHELESLHDQVSLKVPQSNKDCLTVLTNIKDVIDELVPSLYVSQLTSSRLDPTSDSSLVYSDLPPVPSISQGEHPVTGLPVFYLHPCNTQSFLQLIDTFQQTKTHAEQLYIWLQTFGSIVSLDIPPFE